MQYLGRVAVAASALALLLPGATSARSTAALNVFAAASLTDVFPRLDGHPHYQFAGSDQLAFQIEQGAPADVFAAASPKYQEQLYREGLVQKPIAFATNTLVVIVPKANHRRIHSIFDLDEPGLRIVVGDPSVPVGSYTRTVLKNAGILDAVLKNVVSQEPDVRSVTAKVALGEADAGFVYVTDARSVRGKVRVIVPRASLQPQVVYEAAVVKRSGNLAAAYAFVTRLIRPAGQRALAAAGFGPRPRAR